MKGNTAYKKAFIVGILFVLVACTLLFSTSIFFNRSGNLQTSTDKAQTSNYPFDGLQIMKKAVEMTKGTNRYDCSGFVAAVIADLSGVNVSKLTNIGTSGWQSGSFTFQHSNGITYGIGSPIARRDGVKGKSTSWTDFLGRENLSKLRAGDIICGEGHMFIYIGHFESTDNASFPYTNNKDMGQQKMLEYLASQGIKTDGLNINNNASRGNYCTNYWFVEGNVDGNGNYIPTIRNYSWAIPESSWYQEWSNNMNNIKVYRFSPGTRKYHAYVGKKSSSDPEGPYIGGVTFSIKKPGETKSSDYTITENNRFNFTGEVTMSSTGSDNYVIGEKSAPSGYKLRGGTYGFNVIKTIKNGYYAIDHIKYYSGANDTYKQANIGIGETWWILEDRTAKKDGVTDEEKKKAIGSIELAADGGAFQFIELNEPSGGYHMYVSKQDYDTGNLLEGAEYSIKQIIDNVDVGTSPYTDGNSKVITKADKEAYVFWEKDKNVITKKTNKNNYTEVAIKNAGSDRYEIKEVKAPNGYVIGNSTPIVLQLNKVMRADNSGFEIDSIEIYGRPETKVTAPADSSQAAWLRIDYDGNITTDENNYWFAADFHRGTSSAIQVRFKDKKAEYSMDIDKVSSEDGSYLKYAIFKVKYYKDTKVENYDGQLYHNYGSENDMDMNCIETATIHNFTEESVSSYGSVEIPVSEDYNLKSLSTGGSITVDENGNNIDNSKSNPPITMSVTSGDVRDIMQISEVLAPETYKKIVNSPINLAIHKSNNNTYLADSEGNYKIFAIELLDSNGRSTGENGYTISENEILKIDGNGNIVDSNPVITISFSGSKISVKWKNEPIKSEYDVKIKKINKTLKNQAIQGVKFRVNGSETEPTGVDGLTYAKENVTISRYNVNEVDEYRITEVNLGTNQGLIKFVGELQVYVSKGYNSDKDLYEVTNVSFANNSDIKTKEIALENGDIATATVELVNGVVEITIPNEIEGNYNLKIGKKSAKNNEYIGNKDSGYAISDDDYLADAQFTVEQYLNVDKRVQNNANYLTEEHKTDTVEGITSLENEPTQVVFKDGANVNINNVDLIDIYKITETTPPPGFAINKDELYLKVYKKIDTEKNKFVIDRVDVCQKTAVSDFSIIYVGTMANREDNEGLQQLWGGTYGSSHFRVDLDKETNTIIFVIGNDEISDEGEYKVNLIKNGTDGTTLGGVKFTAKNKVNGASEYTDIATDSNPIITSDSSAVAIGDTITIDKNYIDQQDKYIIREVDIGDNSNYYIGIDKDIKVKINKKSELNVSGTKKINSVSSIELELEGETVIKESDTKSLVNLSNGSAVVVELNKNTKTITITVTDPERNTEGYYGVRLVKKGTDGIQLGGVKFTAKNKVNGAVEYTDIATNETPITTSATTSKMIGDNVTIATESVTTPDEYILREVDIGIEHDNNYYIGINKDIKVIINKKSTESADGSRIINSASSVDLEIEGETIVRESNLKSTVTLDNGTIVEVKLSLSRIITITVSNPLKTESGEYKLNLVKKGTDGTQLAGVKFAAKRKTNGATGYTNITAENTYIETLADSAVDVGDTVTIDRAHIETADEYIITEKEIGEANKDKYYIGIDKDITIKINKTSVESEDKSTITNSATGVELEIAGETVTKVSETKSTVTLANGTVVTVELNTLTKTITIIVENPQVTESGEYKVNLVKKGTDGTQLGGVKFTAKRKINGATDYTNITAENTYIETLESSAVDVGDIVTIDRAHIETADEYVIREKEIGEANKDKYYIGIDKDITIRINKTSVESQDKSTITNSVAGVELKIEGETVTKVSQTKSIVTLTNGTVVTVELNTATKTIAIIVENPQKKQDGFYRVFLVKKNAKDGKNMAGVSFIAKRKVNGAVDYTDIATEANPIISLATTSKAVGETVTIDKTYINTPDEYVIRETDIGTANEGKYYIGIDKDIKIRINKTSVESEDGSTITNSASSVDLEIEGEDVTKISNKKSTVTLENGTIVTIELNSKVVKLTVSNPSKVEVGGYKVNLVKKGTDGTQLGGVKFTAKRKINGATNYTNITAENTYIETLESSAVDVGNVVKIDRAHIETADEYVIREKEIGETNKGKYYIGIDKDITIKINKTSVESDDKSTITNSATGIELEIAGESVTKLSETKSTVTLDNGTVVTVELNTATKTITAIVENPQVTESGEYKVNLVKKGTDGTQLGGVKFTAKRKINGAEHYTDITTEGNYIETLADSAVDVGDTVTIDRAHVETADEYVLREHDIGNNDNYYIGITKDIIIKVNKKTETSLDGSTITNSVKSISLQMDGEKVIKINDEWYIVNLENGSKVTVKLVDNIVTVTVTNPKKEGTFNLNLVKYIKGETTEDGSPKPLAGAKFTIQIKQGEQELYNQSGLTTGDDGYITGERPSVNITADNLEYTIIVTETEAPAGYIKLGEPITFTATSTSENGVYKLITAEKTEIKNDCYVTVNPSEIFIEAENKPEPVIHKGVKTVENQDSGYNKNEIQTWVINSSVPAGISDYTKYVITDTIDPDITDNSKKRITFINEENPASNVVVKIKGTDTVLTAGEDYSVDFNTTKKELKVTFIDGNAFVGGKMLPENSTLEIAYKTQFTLDDNGNIIGINQSIPNQARLTYNGNGAEEDSHKDSERPEVHTGGVGVFKYEIVNGEKVALAGAGFRLTKSKEEAQKAVEALQIEDSNARAEALSKIDFVKKINSDGTEGDVWEVETDSTGHAKFEGLEFGEDALREGAVTKEDPITHAQVYTYDWTKVKTNYYMVETYVPENYVLLKNYFTVEVSATNYNQELDLTRYYEVENHKVIEEGDYAVSIQKNGKTVEETETEGIEGVRFEVKRKINGQEEFEKITSADQDAIVTDATGYAQLGSDVTMNKESKDIADIYVIKELSVPETSKYLLGFTGELTLKINKDVKWSDDKEKVTNVVKGITMEADGAKVEKVNDFKYKAMVTKNGQELELVAEFNTETNILTLTVENPLKKGEFDLDIVKAIKRTSPAETLSGAGFKISIKDDEGNFVTDKDGNVIDGSKEYFVGTEGENKGKLSIKDINIKEAGINYNIEIEESTVPAGYIGIGQPIKYTATSVVYADKLGLDKDTKTISNDVKVKVEEGQVWIDVQNKPEPVIHKGVKTVENQDSGYDKNEIQTWVINSSIPAGISDYTKYVITDTIDPDITDSSKKRITFINEENPASNVVVKIKGTDTVLTAGKEYSVTFDTTKKELKVTFIDGNTFVGGKKLPENSTLEITYKTQFTLDENGNIIGINQSIPNQAHLTYNGNGKEEKTKKSEKPEIHTGGVGVFKYDDENGNGQYDEGEKALEGAHFRATKSKTEAQKAVAIILKYEEEGKTKEELEEALKEIDFVKEKSADGKETDKAIEVVTGRDGKAVIEGLEFGEDAINKVKVEYTGVDGAPVYKYKWDEAQTKYYLVETETPYGYLPLEQEEEVIVRAKNYNNLNLTKYYEFANKSRIYDLSLRKFITQVDDKEITDREPQVTLTDEFKDEENNEVTTAKYEHTKEPVVVQQGNIVTYTIRIYNEGPEDAYASIVKDDIPDGVEFVQYTEGDGSVNDEYRWKLVDDKDNEVTDASKAKYIITDYLSMEQGEIGEDGRNSNLLKKFNSKTMDKLDYRDIKVQFRVIEPNTSDRILINYAQISEETDSNGKIVKDRDSIPNVWNEGEDDQDIEQIKLLYFDLALRKWVTKAIVVEDGQTHVFETGHKAEDDPEDVVKVDLKKSKLDKVIVKFEYQIRITNQGKIGGWADEVTDHIPDGLKFEQADNPIWTPVDEQTIVTDELKDVYLEPGESTEVTVILTWINSGDNLGIKNNIAEISKDRNEYGVPDIDSTPGNYKWGEDDIDDAPVMLAIKTGSEIIMYVMLGVGVITIIGAGVAVIKRRF